jgi:hypothetical protein
MPYNLPPPWDPGFAMPQNVLDEGDQRQAFVTKEMPRGTYYQSAVGYGGYAVPKYVKDEGYGQGTFTSKWLPPGTSTFPPIPHWQNFRPQVTSDAKMPGGGRKIVIRHRAAKKLGSPATTGVLAGITDPSTFVPLAAAAGVAYLLFRKKGRR